MKGLLQHRTIFNLMQKCDFLTATKKIPHVNMHNLHNLQSALFINSYLQDEGRGSWVGNVANVPMPLIYNVEQFFHSCC